MKNNFELELGALWSLIVKSQVALKGGGSSGLS